MRRKLALVHVALCRRQPAPALSHIGPELAIILLTSSRYVGALSVKLTGDELARVRGTIRPPPQAQPVHRAAIEIALIHTAIAHGHRALSVHDTIDPLTLVLVVRVGKPVPTMAIAQTLERRAAVRAVPRVARRRREAQRHDRIEERHKPYNVTTRAYYSYQVYT